MVGLWFTILILDIFTSLPQATPQVLLEIHQELQIDNIYCAVIFFLLKTCISCKGTGKNWMEIALHASTEI